MLAHRAVRVLVASVMALGAAAGGACGRSVHSPGTAPTAGHTGTRAEVPWARVGPGWELVLYSHSTARPAFKNGPTTLYLVDPSGALFVLDSWPASRLVSLAGWSGDMTRALLGAKGGFEQLTLATGQVSKVFAMPAQVSLVGYTRPRGQQLLGMRVAGPALPVPGPPPAVSYARYTLAGKLVKVLAAGPAGNTYIPVYSPDGTMLATPGSRGLQLLSSQGKMIRQLTFGAGSCHSGGMYHPVRWWDADTILAACNVGGDGARLWLVPATGAPATPLNTPGGPYSTNAWRLPGGLYLQILTQNGSVQIARQRPDGPVVQIGIPGVPADLNDVVTAAGPRLLVQVTMTPGFGYSLLWFNPATGAERWLFRAPPYEYGAMQVAAYYSQENAGT